MQKKKKKKSQKKSEKIPTHVELVLKANLGEISRPLALKMAVALDEAFGDGR